MKRWGKPEWYTGTPKLPPPEHGVKVNQAGTTWWGQRWITALEAVLRADSGRLQRGKTYARAGRAHDFGVKNGEVSANVTGSRPTPYRVTIALRHLSDAAWEGAIAAMAEKAQFAAELLSGSMPREVEALFATLKHPLFPSRRDEIQTSCSCPDSGDPCKHVAAVHFVLGEAFDRDPFLLFELRGRTKEQVLSALRKARGSETFASEPQATPSVTFDALSASEFERPREALPLLHFSFEEPESHGAVLQQLGTPAAWSGKGSPADALVPQVRAAAEAARRVALSEPASEPVTTPPESAPVRSKPARAVKSRAKKPKSPRAR